MHGSRFILIGYSFGQQRNTAGEGSTDCGGDSPGCRKMESQIRLACRRQGLCESFVLIYCARHGVWRRPRHCSARDSIGPRLDFSCLAITASNKMPLLLDGTCIVPSDLCSARLTQTIRDRKHPVCSQREHRTSCQQTRRCNVRTTEEDHKSSAIRSTQA